jgi:hypothetical protein
MMSDAASPVAPVGVWVQLLVGEEKQGQSFRIKPIPEDVDALKMAVFPELTPREVAKCLVFPPGADPKTETALKANALVPSDATYDNPLIVVAPKPQQQPPQDGESVHSSSCVFLYSKFLFELGNRFFGITLLC